jgi:hypothetical protein
MPGYRRRRPSRPTGVSRVSGTHMDGMRLIVRRERPHPGAQLTFADHDGWRFQAFATDTRAGQLAHLEARHRAHARVEDRIRCAKPTAWDGCLTAVGDQRRLGRARFDRRGPDRLDPNHTPRRRPRPRRTEDVALPTAARRCPDHPRATPTVRPDRQDLALARAARHCLRPTPHAAAVDHLTAATTSPPTTEPRRPRPRAGRQAPVGDSQLTTEPIRRSFNPRSMVY